jgi:methyl-accepting chemotaxis protein
MKWFMGFNLAMSDLSRTTQTNASASEELTATAEEMSSQALQLKKAIAFSALYIVTLVAALWRLLTPPEYFYSHRCSVIPPHWNSILPVV